MSFFLDNEKELTIIKNLKTGFIYILKEIRKMKNTKETHEFLIPDYYLKFSCKMGNCRSACCVGWPISISMKNYFYLIGLDCKKNLRDRLDCGLHVIDHPTEDRYARFEPKYDGNCPLRMQDGRCALHAELGEEILPDVCRLYPRGIRSENGIYECSCANSCEGVLEILFEQNEPISFVKKELTFQMPPEAERKSFFETFGMDQKIRMYFISVIQDRNLSLTDRLVKLGEVIDKMDLAMKSKDRKAVLEIIDYSSEYFDISANDKKVSVDKLSFGLDIAERLVEIFDARSQSIRGCGEAALSYFGKGETAVERYYEAYSHFENAFPKWEIFYEHMLVNHMFFSQFPFQDRPESMHDEYMALCTVYAMMRFLGLGCTAEKCDRDALTDGMAAVFRLIDHTEFDRYASHVLKELDCVSKEQIFDLVSL